MSQYEIEYSYVIPETGVMVFELEDHLDGSEKEEIALAEIKEIYDDILDVEIKNIRKI